MKTIIKEITESIKKEPGNFTYCCYIPPYLLLWINYIFTPYLTRMDSYGLSESADPLIVLGLAGFIMLSLWFTFSFIIWYSAKYTVILTIKILNEARK